MSGVGEEDSWSQGGESQAYTNEEADYEAPPWPGDGYSSSEYEFEPREEELEPEPLDSSLGEEDHTGWSREENDHTEDADSEISVEEEESYVEERPWCEIPYSDNEGEVHEERWREETESQFSQEEEDVNKPDYEGGETDSHISLEDSEADFGEEKEYPEDCAEEEEVLSEAGGDCDPRYICFSGRDQGPEAYLRWEKDMDEWFHQNQVLEEERTAIAEATLIEEAFFKWDVDAYSRLDCELPDHTWEEMKQFLHKTFVEEIETDPYYSRCQIPQEPRRWITVTPSEKSSSPNTRKRTPTNPKERLAKEETTPKRSAKKPQEETNVSSSNNST